MVKLCPCGKIRVFTDVPKEYNWEDAWNGVRPSGVKRVRIKCPLCGRRIMSSVMLTHDADDVMHTLPPHKPKAWWKINKKRKTVR